MIYIASLIDYNRVLLEDHGVNCMLESVNVFQETNGSFVCFVVELGSKKHKPGNLHL